MSGSPASPGAFAANHSTASSCAQPRTRCRTARSSRSGTAWAPPPFSEDLEAAPAPAGVTDLRQVIAEADGLLFATPEYNGSVPGQLKNAIDWASRPPRGGVLQGKPAAVISASPTPYGAAWAQA